MIRKLSHKSLDAEDISFIEYYRLLEGQKDVWASQYKEKGIEKAKKKKPSKQLATRNKISSKNGISHKT